METKKVKLRYYLKKEINGRGLKFIINVLFNPCYNSVFLIRLYQSLNFSIFKKIVFKKLVFKYGIFIGENSEIGIGLTMGHPNGIIIGDGVKIGENCTIYQQVTFGVKNPGDEKLGKYLFYNFNWDF